MDLLYLFQGIGTLCVQEPKIVIGRIALVLIGMALVFLGAKKTLEPLVMIPMGFGMSAVNAGMLFFDANKVGNLLIDPLVTETTALMTILQIDAFQPIYTFAFSNNLIACIVFMGIGVISDLSYLMAFPFTSMLIAICAELGTIVTYPIAVAMGLTPGQAAAAAIVGGADGPLVLFSSLMLAPELFVPITVIAYLYLSLCYGGYPFLIRLLVPKELRGMKVKTTTKVNVTSQEKLIFSVVACTVLCFLLPAAAPLLLSFFLGIAIRESGVTSYINMIESTFLYAATFFLGLMLGILCDANTILNPTILPLLILGVIALGVSGIGGIIGGYIVYFINHRQFNPTIGIAGVSCVPSTAKIAQHEVAAVKKSTIIIQFAMGASICGVLTSAILTGIYITVIPMLK
ncbi:MAG: Na+-translocating decarboxylase subunit beta [Firmicutes bacterium HGW-Firmicutes-15]|nr:MAG: Na+-translocating decarboxylase subunit beta [Firmicutes bacterium HGW-Firmicutes-15]